MKFEVGKDSGFTEVTALPSDPEGYFVVRDPFCGNIKTKQIAVSGIKSRHVRKFEAGDTSIMGNYVSIDPDDTGEIHFSNCHPGIPDPLQPIGTLIYAGNAREVPPPPPEDRFVAPEKQQRRWPFTRHNPRAELKPVQQAKNAHEAVGLWWAHLVLAPVLDTGDGTVVRPELPLEAKKAYEARTGAFAVALASLSAKRNTTVIRVDYHPDAILREAAEISQLPVNAVTFSWKSFTEIRQGVVMARAGRSAEQEQIWPPDQFLR